VVLIVARAHRPLGITESRLRVFSAQKAEMSVMPADYLDSGSPCCRRILEQHEVHRKVHTTSICELESKLISKVKEKRSIVQKVRTGDVL
jgi:hypothetical protein